MPYRHVGPPIRLTGGLVRPAVSKRKHPRSRSQSATSLARKRTFASILVRDHVAFDVAVYGFWADRQNSRQFLGCQQPFVLCKLIKYITTASGFGHCRGGGGRHLISPAVQDLSSHTVAAVTLSQSTGPSGLRQNSGESEARNQRFARRETAPRETQIRLESHAACQSIRFHAWDSSVAPWRC